MKPKHLHLPGFEKVEHLAILLLQLADDTDHHIVPTDLQHQISNAVAALHDHDKSTRNFVKKYESKSVARPEQCSTKDKIQLDEVRTSRTNLWRVFRYLHYVSAYRHQRL